MSKEEFYKYGESLGISINDLQRLRMLAKQDMTKDVEYWQGEFEHWHGQAMEMAEEVSKLKKSIQKAVDLMCEADDEIALLKEQLNKKD